MFRILPLTCALSLLGLVACQGDALAPQPVQAHAESPEVSSLTNSWATKAAMPTARVGLAVASVSGTIYAIGGAATGWAGSGPHLRTVEAYSKADNAWSSVAPLPSNRAYTNGAVVINGRIYLTGGLYKPPPIIGKPSLDPAPTRSLFVYDPVKNAWTKKADMPLAGYGGASVAINGKLYVVLGGSEPGKVGSLLYRYDPATDSWSQRASVPNVHHSGVAAAINGKLYVAGGWANKTSFAELDVYNPATDSWVTKAPLPAPRYGAAGRAIDGKFYVAGGLVAGAGNSNRLDVYNPATNTWTRKTDIPTARWAAAAAVAGGVLHVIGGDGPGVSAVNEAYTP